MAIVARSFIVKSRPFIRQTRHIARDISTKISPANTDIIHTWNLYGSITSTILTIFTISKVIIQAAEDSVHSYDSYDADDDE